MPISPEILAQLDALLAEIQAAPDPRRASAQWKQSYNLLKKTSAAGNHLDNVIARRGVDGLVEVIESLRAPASGTAADDTDPADRPDDATCKAALRGFKKRLKFMRLDEESRIDSRNPMSKGVSSHIRAIEPPREWGPDVWAELVRRGDLVRAGKGFYELPGEPMQ